MRLSNGVTGITPVTFGVPRKDDLTVTLTMAGHETAVRELKSGLDRAGSAYLVGDLLLAPLDGAGLVSAVVDDGTGAFLAHRPNPLKVTLRPVPSGASKPGPRHDLEAE